MPSWLKTFGQDALKVVAVLAGLAPLAEPVAAAAGASPAVQGDLTTLAGIVQQVEVISASTTLTSAQKLEAATALAAPYLQKWVASAPGVEAKVTDAGAFIAKVSPFVSAFVDLIQSVEVKPA
jgi:hypothetical protein